MSFFNPRFGFEPGPGFHLWPLLRAQIFWVAVALMIVLGLLLEWWLQ